MARNLWIACSFLFVVAQFAFLRGLDVRQLLLFVVPVVVAVAIAQQDPATRGSRIAQVFILLISIGMFVAEIPWLFPNLGGVDPKLPRGIDRALAWYVTVYLLFFTCI